MSTHSFGSWCVSDVSFMTSFIAKDIIMLLGEEMITILLTFPTMPVVVRGLRNYTTVKTNVVKVICVFIMLRLLHPVLNIIMLAW